MEKLETTGQIMKIISPICLLWSHCNSAGILTRPWRRGTEVRGLGYGLDDPIPCWPWWRLGPRALGRKGPAGSWHGLRGGGFRREQPLLLRPPVPSLCPHCLRLIRGEPQAWPCLRREGLDVPSSCLFWLSWPQCWRVPALWAALGLGNDGFA